MKVPGDGKSTIFVTETVWKERKVVKPRQPAGKTPPTGKKNPQRDPNEGARAQGLSAPSAPSVTVGAFGNATPEEPFGAANRWGVLQFGWNLDGSCFTSN